MIPGLTLVFVFLVWGLAAPLLDPARRPALPGAMAVYASGGELDVTLTPTPIVTLARWDAPTPTPQPAALAISPAALSRSSGPAALALWTGETMSVVPASGQWQAGVYEWNVPRHAAGWHTDTPDCGAGVTIIGGHVAFDGLPGVFAPLAAIGEGDTVTCTDARGVEHRFAPVDYILSAGDQDPATWTPDWTPALLLYTCTPELDGQLIVIRFRESP